MCKDESVIELQLYDQRSRVLQHKLYKQTDL
jgi:hypothetical protein